MYDNLTHAVEELELQPGETRSLQLTEYEIAIRRRAEALPPVKVEKEQSALEDMLMLDPWVALPAPTPIARVRVRPGKLPMPVPPVIPPYDEGEPS
jgi:hypothetical protein